MNPILCEIAWPEWLFGNPWPVVVVLVLLFAGLRLAGRRLENKKMLQTSWAALAALALVIAGAYVIETPAEARVRQTRELVEATIGPDFKSLDRLLAPEVKVSVGEHAQTIMTGDKALRERLRQAQVKSVSCSGMECVGVDDYTRYVRVSVEASGAQWESHGMTTWRIYWSKASGSWRVTELRLVNAPLGMMGQINLRGK